MFEGKTADCLAPANTAILMQLIEQLIAQGAIAKPSARTLLRDAVSDLKSCPDASRTHEAIAIIRSELMPRFFEFGASRLGCRLRPPWLLFCSRTGAYP